ncbi:MAG: PIN domain-containing protein [Chthoniobacterales bacterium]|nr:PIN domain-containing protein [Chthoniobacterales bacterium]
MIFPDANLLLYAVNSDSPDHDKAWSWWEALLERDEPVAVCAVVAFAFVRLATHPRVFSTPLSVNEAFAYLDNWLEFPSVSFLESEKDDLKVARSLLEAVGTGGNLVTDAQIAAMSLRRNGTVCSADADFSRFPGVKWQDPLRLP